MSGTDVAYSATRCAVLTARMMLPARTRTGGTRVVGEGYGATAAPPPAVRPHVTSAARSSV
eukprot:1674434-Rhodomonas_salina.1